MDTCGEERDRRMTGMRAMKKLTMILVLILAAVLLTACGGSGSKETAQTPQTAATEAPAADPTEAPAEETKTAAAQPLTDRVSAAAKDASELVPFSADELTDMTGIVPEDYTDFVFLQGNGMDGREILILTAADEAAADRIAGLMESYLERRRDENRNYAPDAYKLFSEAQVVRKGLMLAMISGADAAAETEQLLAGE